MPAGTVVARENNARARIDGDTVILIFDRAVFPESRDERGTVREVAYQPVIVSGA
jgi:hypothetical protein